VISLACAAGLAAASLSSIVANADPGVPFGALALAAFAFAVFASAIEASRGTVTAALVPAGSTFGAGVLIVESLLSPIPPIGAAAIAAIASSAMIYRVVARGRGMRCSASRILGTIVLEFAILAIVGNLGGPSWFTLDFFGLAAPVDLPFAAGAACLGAALLALPGTRSSSSCSEARERSV